MMMPGRNKSFDDYRFGQGTQERSDEVYGKGNLYSAKFWEYDSRIGRRWNVDPVVKYWLSSYSSFSNNPITRIDPLGDDDYFGITGNFLYSTKTKSNQIFVFSYNPLQLRFVNLIEYRFNVNNYKVLLNITNYYAVFAKVDKNRLYNKDFSIGNGTPEKFENGGYTGATISESLYNNGDVSWGGSSVMHTTKSDHRFVIPLFDGYLSSKHDTRENFISTMEHEDNHLNTNESDTWEHLSVYYKQVTSPTFKGVIKEYLENTKNNISELLEGIKHSLNTANYSQSDKASIQSAYDGWKRSFQSKFGKDFAEPSKKQ